ncbi:hypothetical protein H2248_007631 [Termitomyces sp. 'cryptogamus']|nr:hypothetical protein H2248_007631 [Termitomyces sp. 'cryptogamus']
MFPVRISHVCHSWRQIALRTPRLWRRIALSSNIDMWKERISRAGACTLDIQLFPWRPTRWSASERQYIDAMAIQWYLHPVMPLLRRWRSFEVVFKDYSPYLWNAALSGLCSRSRRSRAPTLQNLTLIYPVNDDTKEFCLFSGYAPNLRNVTLDGIRLTWLPSLFGNLVFLDYTHHGFSLGHQAVYDVVVMLEISCRLVELRILFPPRRRVVSHTRSSPVARRVLLPSLQRLHLRVEGSDIPFELMHLMSLILTPSLTSLSLIDVDHRRPTFPGLRSFFYIYAISPSIRLLRIEYRWYDPRMVSPIVSALPHLRRIVIRRPQMSDQVLNLSSRNRKARWIRDFLQPVPSQIDKVHTICEPTIGHSRYINHHIYVRPPVC